MGSKLVQNVGSEARDHLANERTFLAWLRTSLGLVGLGVLLGRLGNEPDQWPSRLAGLGSVLFGVGCLAYAMARYAHVARCLRQGRFPVAQNGPLLVGAASLAAGVLVLVYLAR